MLRPRDATPSQATWVLLTPRRAGVKQHRGLHVTCGSWASEYAPLAQEIIRAQREEIAQM
jgi:hypothetical protein